MRIAIIGKGRVGRALASALGARHEIRIGARTPGSDQTMAVAEAAAWADLIILATPYAALSEVAAAIYPQVDGKIVIDTANPVGMTEFGPGLVTRDAQSAAENLRTHLPTARIVKTFNQIGAEFLSDPGQLVQRPVQFVAADDDDARRIAGTLVDEAGFDAVDFGPLANARYLEGLAMVWIWSALKGPLGRDFGFALTRRADSQNPSQITSISK